MLGPLKTTLEATLQQDASPIHFPVKHISEQANPPMGSQGPQILSSQGVDEDEGAES